MSLIPIVKSGNQAIDLFQSRLKSELDPILSLPILDGNQLTNVSLAIGENTINHLLSRKMQGWLITDLNAGASIYRSKALNDKTISLTSDTVCIVSLWVY